jgi:hypothetical protein
MGLNLRIAPAADVADATRIRDVDPVVGDYESPRKPRSGRPTPLTVASVGWRS